MKQLITFFGLAYLISWAIWLPLYGDSVDQFTDFIFIIMDWWTWILDFGIPYDMVNKKAKE